MTHLSVPIRLRQGLHSLREALDTKIVPREELTRPRAVALLLVVAVVCAGGFAVGRETRSEGASASTGDQPASGVAVTVARLGTEPALPALFVPPAPKPSAPAAGSAIPPPTTTTPATLGESGGASTPATGPAPPAPSAPAAPTPTPAPAPSNSGGQSFYDSG